MTKEQLEKLGIKTDKENLTAEEIDALVEQRVAELTGENAKNKTLISQRNSEIAEYKRKEQERLTEEERKALLEKEKDEKIAKYEREIAKSGKVAEYMAIGYPKELAEKVADAEIEGKSTAKYHDEFVKSREQSIRAELMAGNPNPNGGGDDKPVSLEQFKKMKPSELVDFQEKHPQEFENLSKQI